LQKAFEPQTQNVLQIKDEKRHHSEEEAPSGGDAPGSM